MTDIKAPRNLEVDVTVGVVTYSGDNTNLPATQAVDDLIKQLVVKYTLVDSSDVIVPTLQRGNAALDAPASY